MTKNPETTTPTRRASRPALPGRTLRTRRRRADLASQVATIVILSVAAAGIIAPFLWVFRASLSANDAAVYRLPPDVDPSQLTLGNFPAALAQVPFTDFIINSLLTAGTITIAQMVTCSMAGYAFARLEFRGKAALFAIVIGSLMIPLQVTIVPIFLVMSKLGLTNTLWSLILPPTFSAFGIFLMRQHFLTLPRELEEAARVDGAGHARTFVQIMVPLSGPSLATLGILTFTYWWNDLLLPLVMINDPETQTLPVGLVLLAGRFSTGSLGTIAAGITMAVIPVLIVFLIAQRWIVASIASSGLKL